MDGEAQEQSGPTPKTPGRQSWLVNGKASGLVGKFQACFFAVSFLDLSSESSFWHMYFHSFWILLASCSLLCV